MSDITYQQEIESIKNQLLQKFHPSKIILFGSAARDDFSPDSDLDFLVIKDDSRRPLEVEQELHRIIDYRIASDFLFLPQSEYQKRLQNRDLFLQEIVNNGKILYG